MWLRGGVRRGRGLPCSVALLLLAVAVVPRGVPALAAGGVGSLALAALWAVFGVVDLAAEAEDLPALAGAQVGAHLQRQGEVVALVRARLGVVDVPPGARSCHAHLEGQDSAQPCSSLLSLPTGAVGLTWLAHLLVPIWRLMVEWSMGGRIWFLGS